MQLFLHFASHFDIIFPCSAAVVQALPGGLDARPDEPGHGGGEARPHDQLHLRLRDGGPRAVQVERQDALSGEN